jgi:hypothetical protein
MPEFRRRIFIYGRTGNKKIYVITEIIAARYIKTPGENRGL